MGWLEREVARIESGRHRKAITKKILFIGVFFIIAAILAAALYLVVAEERRTVVIRVEGQMVAGDFTGGGYVGSEYVGRQLRDAADDPLVEAIVLRVNSGGGTPTSAQEIIRDIEYARARKPVVVSMGDMAASAAYQISAHADVIYANPDTITGGIGSIWTIYDNSGNMEKEGFAVEVIKSGDKKDMTSPYRPLTEDEREYAQVIVNESFERFIADVIAQRGVVRDLIEDARVFRGEDAQKIGLVDEMGNLFDAIDGAKALAGGTRSSCADLPS
jgi:protease-4